MGDSRFGRSSDNATGDGAHKLELRGVGEKLNLWAYPPLKAPTGLRIGIVVVVLSRRFVDDEKVLVAAVRKVDVVAGEERARNEGVRSLEAMIVV